MHFTHRESNRLNWSRMLLKADFTGALESLGRLPLRDTKQVIAVQKNNMKLQKLIDAVMTEKQRDFTKEI